MNGSAEADCILTLQPGGTRGAWRGLRLTREYVALCLTRQRCSTPHSMAGMPQVMDSMGSMELSPVRQANGAISFQDDSPKRKVSGG